MFTDVIKINTRNLINYICLISMTKKCLSFHMLMKRSIKELDFYYKVFNPLRLHIKTWQSSESEWVHSNTLTATRQKAGKQLKYSTLLLPHPRFECLSY